jgi:hypothetical protein
MDRFVVGVRLRRAYAHAQSSGDKRASAIVIGELEAIALEVLGPSFSLEPDMQRTTDATPARMSALRPVPSAPRLSVIPGGGAGERPSDRFIDDDSTPKAG